MTKEQITNLLGQYNSGQYTPEVEQQIEWCLEHGFIELHQLKDIQELDQQLDHLVENNISHSMRNAFQQMINLEQELPKPNFFEQFFTKLLNLSPYGLTTGLAVFLIGIFAGQVFQPKGNSEDLAILSDQVLQMKEMMMLSMIDKESTSDRLKAVNMAQDIPSASDQITEALIKTLNTDQNINVRMAALDALYQYANKPEVRMHLIQSIEKQSSPLIQMALAEVMVALQEKRSVEEFRKLFNQNRVPGNVKITIEEKLKVLL